MSQLKGKSVLIVEDSANVRSQLKELYESFGMVVKGEAENGVVALALLESETFDLVSLDIIMPEMNGVECYQEIISQNPNQHCIFFTYLASDPIVLENLRKIISSELIFQKNFSAADILPRIEQLMAKDAKSTIISREILPSQNAA